MDKASLGVHCPESRATVKMKLKIKTCNVNVTRHGNTRKIQATAHISWPT